MLGNSVCQQSCYSPECKWDLGDCGCAPGCQESDYGSCKAECLVADCEYDSMPGFPGCQDSKLIKAAQYYHVALGDFSLPYSYANTCVSAVPLCTPSDWALAHTSCSLKCNTAECGFSFGNCLNPSPCKVPFHCSDCGPLASFGCLSCLPGLFHFYADCVEACPAHYKVVAGDLCVPSVTDESARFYVSAEAAAEGRGTPEDPFDSLPRALAACVFAFCRVLLLPGQHLIRPRPISVYVNSLWQPSILRYSQKAGEILISSIACETSNADCQADPETVLLFDNLNPVQVTISGKVTILGVTLSGRSTLVANCTTEKCTYCGITTGGGLSDDQGRPLVPGFFAPTELCTPFRYYSLFVLSQSATLLLRNCTVSNFRQGFQSVFSFTSAWLSFESVVFLNISTGAVPDNTVFASYSTRFGVIQQNSTNSYGIFEPGVTNEDGGISLDNVTVTLLNNGFELTPGWIQYGFMAANGIKTVSITNSHFYRNIVQSGPFLSAFNFLSFRIDGCSFEDIYVEYFLVKMIETGLMVPGDNGEMDKFNMNHIEVTRTNFTNISTVIISRSVPCAILSIVSMGLSVNLFMQDIHISNSVSSSYIIYYYRATSTIPDREKFGMTQRVITRNNQRVTLIFPKVRTQFSRVTMSALVVGVNHVIITSMMNIEFSELHMRNSSDGPPQINALTLSRIIGKPGVYLTKPITGELAYQCSEPFNLVNVYSVSLTDSHFNKTACSMTSGTKVGLGGILGSMTGDFSLTRVTFAGVSGPSVGAATVVSVVTTGAIYLSEVTVSLCSNFGSGSGMLALSATLGVSIEACLFSDNNSQGATVQVSEGGNLSIQRSIFKGNKSKGQAGLSFVPASGLPRAVVSIADTTFAANSGGDGTAVFITNLLMSPVLIQVQIVSCVFEANSGSGLGTAVLIDSKNALDESSVIRNSKFRNNTAKEGVVVVAFQSGGLKLEGCEFVENSGQSVSCISASQQPSTPQNPTWLSVFTSNFTRNSGTTVIKVGNPNGYERLNTARNRFTANNMRVFELDRTNLTDSFSVYDSNLGSALRLTTLSQGIVSDSMFSSGTDAIGGAIYLGGSSTLSCVRCSLNNNSANTHGGAVFIEQASVFTASDCSFLGNEAGGRGSAVYLFGSPSNSSFRNTNFLENRSGDSATVAAISASIRFLNCTFSRNSARKSAGITAYFSNVSLADTAIVDHYNLTSPLIYSALESIFTIRGCKVAGLSTTSDGGVIYALSSVLFISASTFVDIKAESGGLLLAEAGTVFSISTSEVSSVISNNRVIVASAGSGSINKTLFHDFSIGGISAIALSLLQLTGVTFQSKSYLDGQGLSGTAVYCSSCAQVLFNSCTFSNLNASSLGAAVYIVSSFQHSSSHTASFSDCSFHNLTGRTSGAVVLENINGDFSLSRFSNCRAVGSTGSSNGVGGALSFLCSQSEQGCIVSIDSCEFTQNSAQLEGGSIHWQDSMPVITNSTFQGGYAYYGPDIASFPVQLHLEAIIGNGTLDEGGKSEGIIRRMASGQIAEQVIIASLLDHYGQIVVTNTDSTVAVTSNVTSTSILGNTNFQVANGTFKLKGFGVTAPPETSTTVYLKSNAIDFSKRVKARDNFTYSDTVAIAVEMRSCELGESHIGDQCLLCPSGKYSLDPKANCKDCVEGAICYGNFKMVPKSGYWRTSIYTDEFWQCPYTQSCTGSPEPPDSLSLTGTCAVGYFGNLCNGCKGGFSRMNTVECGLCPSVAVNSVRIGGILIGVVLFLVLIIWTSIRSAYRARSFFSIYIKILLNYMQLVMLTAGFNLSWPSYVKELFKVQQTAGNITDQIFSIDCFLGKSSDDDQANAVRLKIVMLAFLPVLLFLLGLAFWLPLAIAKHKWSFLKNELITTSVVLFFLVHPSLVKFMFDFLNCRQLDRGEYWMSSYLNIPCWDTIHYRFTFAVAIPCIMLWGIGLPALCLAYIVKNRSQLALTHMRLRLGFIYNGYEISKYYWEFVIIYRKIIIVSIAVFLSSVSVYVQALTVMAVIIVALALQSKNNPYFVPAMNDLELRAILVGGITIYCGMYCLAQNLDYTSQMILFFIILLFNAYFITHWSFRVIAAGWSVLLLRCTWIKSCFPRSYQIKPIHTTLPLSRMSDIPQKSSYEVMQMSRIEGTFEDFEESRIHSKLNAPDNSRIDCEPASIRTN